MSNAKPTMESSTPSETEQGLELGENGSKEDVGENVQQHLGEGTRKENKGFMKDIAENGKKESTFSPIKRNKRKFPSREEISRAR